VHFEIIFLQHAFKLKPVVLIYLQLIQQHTDIRLLMVFVTVSGMCEIELCKFENTLPFSTSSSQICLRIAVI